MAALLIVWVDRGLPLEYITFAGTGGARPHTYQHVEQVSRWLLERGYPPVITVHYRTKDGARLTRASRSFFPMTSAPEACMCWD